MVELRTLAGSWREALPEAIAERVLATGAEETPPRATHVLYWMRAAPRGHDNPALDAAIAAAERLSLPTYVFHGLSPQPLFASPRRLDFALDAAREVARELAARGIPYALHVVRRGEKTRPLGALLRSAALLVTEAAPLEPERTWVAAFAQQPVPLWCVDASSVVPLSCCPRPSLARHRYRDASREERLARLLRPWRALAPRGAYSTPRWPFEPFDPGTLDRSALHAECELPCGEQRVFAGGATSGYTRWNEWKAQGLRAWPSERLDPSATVGAEFAALLDAGHLSPFRLARDAALQGNAGARRWLADHVLRADHAAALGSRLEPSRSEIAPASIRIPELLQERGVLPRAALLGWRRSLLKQVSAPAAEACIAAAFRRYATTGPSPRLLAELRTWRKRAETVEIPARIDERAPSP